MMKGMRRRFLLAIGGVMGGGALAPLAAAPSEAAREIGLLTTHVVGGADPAAARVARKLAPGTRLELRRAPMDRYDRRTVQAWTRDGMLLGRVAPIDAKSLSSLMDAGLRTQARVISIWPHPVRPEIRVEVGVRLA